VALIASRSPAPGSPASTNRGECEPFDVVKHLSTDRLKASFGV
jgi:hypothetical protein